MAVTDWKSPGTVVSDSSVGDIAWSNPSNASASDNSYATGHFDYHEAPYQEFANIVKSDGSIGTTNRANGSSELYTPTETTLSFGGSTDKWGETWSVSDINDSDFGFVFAYDDAYAGKISEYLKVTNFGFSIPTGATIDGIEVSVEYKLVNDGPVGYNDVSVDHIQIRVYYTESGTTAYSRESSASLKADDSNLSTMFSEQDYTDVATDDDTFVDLEGTAQYFQLLFKEPNGNENNTDDFRVTWKGKSTLAPSSSAVYLQIYNRTTESWTTLVSNSSASANVEFTLEDTVSTNLSDYYDTNYIISVRVYQDGVV